jgi:Mrp family chromosome partitioning ATPase
MRVILDRMKTAADIVIFDSPPLQAVTDASVLSSFLDGTVLVIDAGQGHRAAVRQAREALARAGATVLGAVLNRVPRGGASDYAPYYGDYYGSEDRTEKSATGSGTV